MAPELGGSQISALLESVPGIARVLRSPVADAIVNMIRAGARLEPFNRTDAEELIQFAVRRGLINSVEGDAVLKEIQGIGVKRPAKTLARKVVPQSKRVNPFRKAAPKPEAKASAGAKKKAAKPAKKSAKKVVKKSVRKTAKKSAKKVAKKAARKTAKKSAKTVTRKAGKKTSRKVPKKAKKTAKSAAKKRSKKTTKRRR